MLVGLAKPDDAAVYRLPDGRALVQTVDFIPPVVDEPYAYGAISAANALSDIYAMGADPLFALNICAFPEDLPAEVVEDILRGGADKVAEAGAAIAGGHSLHDREPKYGLCVTGVVDEASLLTKGGARAGDTLILTKPLGVGVITTGIKRGCAAGPHVDAATASMARLNYLAGRAARSAGASAATDISGFGLIGHTLEMAYQTAVQFSFRFQDLPFLPGALEYAEKWIFAGGTELNATAAAGKVEFNSALKDYERMLLFDPQTSGGLLVSLAPDKVTSYIQLLRDGGQQAWPIGTVMEGSGVRVLA